jgi:hypothetical protein
MDAILVVCAVVSVGLLAAILAGVMAVYSKIE